MRFTEQSDAGGDFYQGAVAPLGEFTSLHDKAMWLEQHMTLQAQDEARRSRVVSSAGSASPYKVQTRPFAD